MVLQASWQLKQGSNNNSIKLFVVYSNVIFSTVFVALSLFQMVICSSMSNK